MGTGLHVCAQSSCSGRKSVKVLTNNRQEEVILASQQVLVLEVEGN